MKTDLFPAGNQNVLEEEEGGGEGEGVGERRRRERGGGRKLRKDWTDKQRSNYERAIY